MNNKHTKGLHLPAALIIMDGFGISEPGKGNAISQAKTPHLDKLWETYPHTTLDASEKPVGLPEGQMGNSEVGHLNIGAGRVVYQELTRINLACEDGSLAQRPVLKEAYKKASCEGSVLHIMGLLSDGGVHSSNKHLYKLIEDACNAGVNEILVHCFMDGRDVSPTSGVGFLEELQQLIKDHNVASKVKIASVSGRYYAMDRDNRWDRVEKAYKAVAQAKPLLENKNPVEYVAESYEQNITDEFIVPASFVPRGVKENDTIIFFNFRPDRAREISRAFTEADFSEFNRNAYIPVHFVCLTEYEPSLKAEVVFPKEFPENVLADVLADAGLRQYHIAETEKYAHVTFFFNGGIETPKEGEVRKLIASPKVATYDLQPEMSAYEVTDALVDAINNNESDVYIVNFANCDMVGHTGSIPAAIAAVEAVDECVGRVVDALLKQGGQALITADHGNADCMLTKDGKPMTAHTTAVVPYMLIGASEGVSLKEERGALCNISPTLLDIIGLEKPKEMLAESWLERK